MWVYLSDAMFSIVQDLKDQNAFLVRARLAGDIDRHFPQSNVREGEGSDYRFRASVSKHQVFHVINSYLGTLSYPNFKNTVAGTDRAHWYFDTWQAGFTAQKKAQAKKHYVDVVASVAKTLGLCTGVKWTRSDHKLLGNGNERVVVLYSREYQPGQYLYDLHAAQLSFLSGGPQSLVAFCFEGKPGFLLIPLKTIEGRLKDFHCRAHPHSGQDIRRVELSAILPCGELIVPNFEPFKTYQPTYFDTAQVLDGLGDYWLEKSQKMAMSYWAPTVN